MQLSGLSQTAGDGASAPTRRRLPLPGPWGTVALVIGALAALPILAVVMAAPAGGFDAIAHLARTVLWRYAANTALLMLLAGGLAAIVGTGCAWLVAATRFPGRSLFAWALVLPLAVPPYIAAYVYADLLDFSGPMQTALRTYTGWAPGDYAIPDIRSLAGGAFVLGIVLYPYVYLLARTAFAAQSARQVLAARSLGARPWTVFRRIALPAARPAIAGGLALVLMEVLADFGVADYFAIPTFSTGIFRSWLAMGDRQAALKLAALMLLFVILLVAMEARARSGRSDSRDGHAGAHGEPFFRLSDTQQWLAAVACAVPLLLGFAVPAARLGWLALGESGAGAISGTDLWSYVGNSALLGLVVAAACIMSAFVLVLAKSRARGPLMSGAVRFATLGYALPGALLAVGLLTPLGALDTGISRFARDELGYAGGLILSGTGIVLVYALSVRFLTVAFNTLDGGMSKIPPALDAAARSLGAAPGRVFAQIHGPLLAPSGAAATALVAIDTLRELPATLILRPFNFETLATRTYRLASDERLAEAAWPALILLAAGLLPVLLLTRARKR
ncbi:MAG: iron ABC transporter permease [Erythrobacter sp.]